MIRSIRTLGQQQVLLDGQPVHWPSKAAQDLFFLLLTEPSGQERGALIEALWDTSVSANSRNTFKVTLHRLRLALNDADALIQEGQHYRLAAKYFAASDHVLFQELLRKIPQAAGRNEQLRVAYQAALTYAGDFLPLHTGDWASETRSSLHTQHVKLRLEIARLHCVGLECLSGVRNLAGGLAADPLAGEHHDQALMTCLCTLGRPQDAVKHFRHYLMFIQREIGDLPSRETLDLAEHIKNAEGHTARQIGGRLPCPRRLLYGVTDPSAAESGHLDLEQWSNELRRGQLSLKLMRRCQKTRDWTAIRREAEQFLHQETHTAYVWLGPVEASTTGSRPPVLPTTWPPEVRGAAAQVLTEAQQQDNSIERGFGELTVMVVALRERSRSVRAWLCLVSNQTLKGSSWAGDRELRALVIKALEYLLAGRTPDAA